MREEDWIMPLPREDHEAYLAKLLNPEIEHSEKTEILQALRVDYNVVHTDFEGLTQSNEKFKKNNDDLLQSNSMLFRQAGILHGTEKPDVEVKKEFSETVSLELLEKNAGF